MTTSIMTQRSYPNFGARAIALAIDFVLLAIMHFILILLLASRLFDDLMHFEPQAILSVSLSYFLIITVSFVFSHLVYFTLFHSWSGQTIGKMIMGIKVVTKDNKIISPSVSFLRWTGYILSFVPLAAGFLWSVVDRDRSTWHDMLAQTKVVSAEMT